MTPEAFDRAVSETIAKELGVRYCGKQFGYYLYNDDAVTDSSFSVSPNHHCKDSVARSLRELRERFNIGGVV